MHQEWQDAELKDLSIVFGKIVLTTSAEGDFQYNFIMIANRDAGGKVLDRCISEPK